MARDFDRVVSFGIYRVVSAIVVVITLLSCPPASRSQTPSPSVPSIILGQVGVVDLPDGVTSQEAAAIKEAVVDVNKVIASPEFLDAVLRMQASQNRRKSNQAIYDMMKKKPLTINMTLFEGDYKQNHKYLTEGFEDDAHPDTCFINRYFLAGYGYDPGYLASLMLHEAMHVLGFVHKGWGSYKLNSVPYTMNDIYDTVAGKLNLPEAPDDDKFDHAKAVDTEP